MTPMNDHTPLQLLLAELRQQSIQTGGEYRGLKVHKACLRLWQSPASAVKDVAFGKLELFLES